MGQSTVLEWLNENSYRSYPLRLTRQKEVIVKGKGVITPAPYDSTVPMADGTVGGWLINGGTVGGQRTEFLSQVSPGDYIEVNSIRAEVRPPLRPSDMSDFTLYTRTSFGLPATNFEYNVVKRSFSQDQDNQRDLWFDGVLLDANLVYADTPVSVSDVGRLTAIQFVDGDLVISVYGQPDFVVTDSVNATYPYYVRNAAGSLLVVGQPARLIQTSMTFTNQFFEYSTITMADRGWRGVSSLVINGDEVFEGDVRFHDGYQMELMVNAAKNAIKLSAGKAYGRPVGCARIYGDTAPEDCASIVSYINGAEARTDFGAVDLSPGDHVAIYPDPERHRIYVGLTFNREDICLPPATRPVLPL